MFSKKEITRLLIPLIIEQTLTITIGLVDTLMVSSVGEAAVSGVSLIDTFNTLILQLLAALAAGGSVVVSQYLGRRNDKLAGKASGQIVLCVLSFSMAVGLLVVALRGGILHVVYGNIDEDVMSFAGTYFLLSAFSYPFMGLYNAGAALFRVMGNSKVSMMSSIVMNIANVAGNAWLIYACGMGVAGAALASLFSRVLACGTVMYLLQKSDCPLRISSLQSLRPDKAMIRSILAIGIPGGIENGMFQIGKLCVASLTSTLGTAAIAANAVANSVSTMLNIPANSIGMAITPVVGRCIGADRKDEAYTQAWKLMGLAYLGAWAANLSGLFVFNELAVRWFHLSGEAAKSCLELLAVFNIVSLFFWPSSFTLPKVLHSGGDAAFTMKVSIFSMWIFRVALCYLLTLKFHCGLMGVWTGMFVDWGFRSICFGLRFFSKKWMDHRVI